MADIYTDSGRAQLAGYASGVVALPANYFGNVGTGAGTAGITDTTLFTEVGTARITATVTRVTVSSPTNNTAQYVFTFTAASGVNVTNAGYFTLVSGGVLMQKSDHATIPLLSGDSIQYTFQARVV